MSGGQDKTAWEDGIRDAFAGSPHQTHLLHLNGETDAQTIRQAVADFKPDRVVAVGGDGTVKLVAEQLLGRSIPLGILPAGSANGMARELGLPADIAESLAVVVNGTPKLMDIIRVNDDICLHLSDVGLNAQVVRNYQRNNWRGMIGYLRSVLKVLRKRRLLRVEISVGDACVQRAALMIVLANARMYGTGAVINPDGDPSDGQFEVIVFRRLSVWEVLKLFWRYQPFDPKRIEVFPANSVHIETHRRAYFQVDGEYCGQITMLDARIQAGALTVLVPETAAGEP